MRPYRRRAENRDSPPHRSASVQATFSSPSTADSVWRAINTPFAGVVGVAELLASVGAKLLVLGDATVVLPGHGTSTTIGDERRFNPYCKDLSRD